MMDLPLEGPFVLGRSAASSNGVLKSEDKVGALLRERSDRCLQSGVPDVRRRDRVAFLTVGTGLDEAVECANNFGGGRFQ